MMRDFASQFKSQQDSKEVTDEEIKDKARSMSEAFGDEGICNVSRGCFERGAKWMRYKLTNKTK